MAPVIAPELAVVAALQLCTLQDGTTWASPCESYWQSLLVLVGESPLPQYECTRVLSLRAHKLSLRARSHRMQTTALLESLSCSSARQSTSHVLQMNPSYPCNPSDLTKRSSSSP
ncbi:hypothetical protein CC85DRAFT_82433 [Cutaneotrichosporon oleaginosum]|uniref:Secreted protein n=1 Tax=Cutaneotrichosporon oleaginosum TaxID=879819 RepID=A0A0J0XN48_9TREE|nr:uncharacterized protein CC85DRAFT_82433 [Cutaneotrichosporon oleaginosum]KLT42493.1 hypothetical protein CC85DRAFT_82433 [Cutaneotrichosporon oleaginosum]TXT07766.1 hypothetical protein COLE_04690 [Cutaneotrichosporon oleaginosum]